MTAPNATPAQVGTLYKVLGILALAAMVIVDVVGAFKGHSFTMVDLGINSILLVTVLALIRPEKFNDVMKYIASKLPV